MGEIEIFSALLKTAFNSDLGKDLISILAAWLIVRRTVKGHFAAIETSLANINTGVGDLKDAMMKVESAHSSRLSKLETDVAVLQSKPNKES